MQNKKKHLHIKAFEEYVSTEQRRETAYLWMSEMSHQAHAQPPTTYVFSSDPQQPPSEKTQYKLNSMTTENTTACFNIF